MSGKEKLIDDVARYYSSRLAEHGETPKGVDWNGEQGQILRFQQLSKIIQDDSSFTLTDIGCGYGAYLEYLLEYHPVSGYLGVDVSESMILAARKRHSQQASARFITASEPNSVADYCVASGIFNVRLGHEVDEWVDYFLETLDVLDKGSRRGFSFNCLTSYSDEDKKRSDLYYADPCRVFDICKRKYSGQVALLHDYGLYEFTVLVRKVL